MSTRVKIIGHSPYGEFKPGDRGVIDGYCRGGDDIPCAIVILGVRFVMVPIHSIEFDGYE